jgi:hypothetical protein
MLSKGLVEFVPDFKVGRYYICTADPLAKVAVEIDGGDERIKKIDKSKETYLKKRGWYIVRVSEHDIKNDINTSIELIRVIQEKRRATNKEKIRQSFLSGSLKVKSLLNNGKVDWVPSIDVVRHITPHKKMLKVVTDRGSVCVTEDHSLFFWDNKEPVTTSNLGVGDFIVSCEGDNSVKARVLDIQEIDRETHTYDVSVPESECAFLSSGILVHNTYSVSGVSLDVEKSSKYQSMKENFISEYDKLKDQAKRSIKIIKGLQQPRYGVGISSAMGPFSRPGVQSRRNFVSGAGGWS